MSAAGRRSPRPSCCGWSSPGAGSSLTRRAAVREGAPTSVAGPECGGLALDRRGFERSLRTPLEVRQETIDFIRNGKEARPRDSQRAGHDQQGGARRASGCRFRRQGRRFERRRGRRRARLRRGRERRRRREAPAKAESKPAPEKASAKRPMPPRLRARSPQPPARGPGRHAEADSVRRRPSSRIRAAARPARARPAPAARASPAARPPAAAAGAWSSTPRPPAASARRHRPQQPPRRGRGRRRRTPVGRARPDRQAGAAGRGAGDADQVGCDRERGGRVTGPVRRRGDQEADGAGRDGHAHPDLPDEAIEVLADAFDKKVEIVHAADEVEEEPEYEDPRTTSSSARRL